MLNKKEGVNVVADLKGIIMSDDYRKRIENIILDTPIRSMPMDFIGEVALVMKDGSCDIISAEEFMDLTEEYDREDMIRMGIVDTHIHMDMDYAIDVIHFITEEILKSPQQV